MAINKQSVSNHPVKTKLHVKEPLSVLLFCNDLIARMRRHGVTTDTPKILLCIGTDRSTGDCLGPLVGTLLLSREQNFFDVYGTLEKPVHAGNLHTYIEEINLKYKNPFILAVDACLGAIENIGCVSIGDGSLQPGAGVNKNLPSVGSVHITGTVNVGGFMEYMVLQNTRLSLVMSMANLIVEGLMNSITEYQIEEAAAAL